MFAMSWSWRISIPSGRACCRRNIGHSSDRRRRTAAARPPLPASPRRADHRPDQARPCPFGCGYRELGQLIRRHDSAVAPAARICRRSWRMGLAWRRGRRAPRPARAARRRTAQAEEGDAEAGPGVGDDDQPLAAGQCPRRSGGARSAGLGAQVGIGQAPDHPTARVEEVEPGLALGGIVESPHTGCGSRRGGTAARNYASASASGPPTRDPDLTCRAEM